MSAPQVKRPPLQHIEEVMLWLEDNKFEVYGPYWYQRDGLPDNSDPYQRYSLGDVLSLVQARFDSDPRNIPADKIPF